MTLLKRRAVLGAIATGIGWPGAAFAAPTVLKISHQFPGGEGDIGDFRDRLARRFAAEVSQRTGGALQFSVHPGAMLMKPFKQFTALRRGILDMALMPLAYGGVEVPEAHIGLLPGLVSSYDQAYAWKRAEVGRELYRIMLERGIVIVSWIWQAGNVISRNRAIVDPHDAKGMRVRGGSREMDLLLAAAGAEVVSMPSNELYAALQGGTLDAALTSSTSLASFKLEEVTKVLVTGRSNTFWYNFSPLMMSKQVFKRCSATQQAAILAAGEKMETFARLQASLDDSVISRAFQRVGATVLDLPSASLARWQHLARSTSWQDYGVKSMDCNRLLKLAEKTH